MSSIDARSFSCSSSCDLLNPLRVVTFSDSGPDSSVESMPVSKPEAAEAKDRKEVGRSSNPVPLWLGGTGDRTESGQLLVGDVAIELGSGPTLGLDVPNSLGLGLETTALENNLTVDFSSGNASARRLS